MVNESGKLDFIDALRGIAVLGVVAVHVGIATRQSDFAWRLAFCGQRGVQLFFIVSAFTLCYSADRQIKFSVGEYFARRLFRIAPMFYIAAALNAGSGGAAGVPGLDMVAALLFINGVIPTAMGVAVIGGWSVAVEANFYFLFPLLRRAQEFRTLFWLLLTTAIVGFSLSRYLSSWSNDLAHQQYFAFFWLPAELPVFVLGMIVYQAVKKQVFENSHFGRRATSLMLAAVGAIIFWASFPASDLKLYPAAVALAFFVAALAVHPWVVIVNPATRFLGRISFSIYLLHFYALEIVGRSMPGIMGIHPHASLRFAEAFTMTLAVAVPICFATYRLVELPGITAGKRISQTISSIALHPRMEPRAE